MTTLITLSIVVLLSTIQGFFFAIGMIAGVYSMFAIASRFIKAN